jgi:hypothetical protein
MSSIFIPHGFEDYNVPGNKGYHETLPTDVIIQSSADSKLKGYWLEYDDDGQLALVSDQSGADGVTLDVDPDGTPVLVINSTSTTASLDGTDLVIID